MPNLPHPSPATVAVLVVDDEPDVLDSIVDLLRLELPGVQVWPAGSGPAALEVLGRERIDVVLCDHRMPGMDGLEFLIRARQLAPDAARILITAYPELQVAVRAINEAAIQSFVTKPVQPGYLVEVVNASIAKARAQAVAQLADRARSPRHKAA
ncbi:MAG TPA: response regulator [Candidatus Thermoplasmatota archaeon]|nr:response regulator [Candidatus Thermoplasmatota archaeon]